MPIPRPHPFDQLTKEEAERAVQILVQANKGKTIHIKNVSAEEPPKSYMKDYLQAEHSGSKIAPPPRIAYCVFFVLKTTEAEELWIDLDSGKVIKRQAFPSKSHLPCDMVETAAVEEHLLEIPQVQEALAKLGIHKKDYDLVAPDGWMYGCDSDDELPRMTNFLMYMSDPKTRNLDSNVYARPLPFVAIVNTVTHEFVRIDWCASGGDNDDATGINYATHNFTSSIMDNFYGDTLEYVQELRSQPLRSDLKPYNVIQPEGPSFTVDGSLVRWQKWSFRVGFNPREGATLHDIRYDGRQTFYRLAVNEMTVPYGDPRPPLNRKQAFDLGDIGAGNVANSLGLGCDCLGLIKYFNGTIVNGDGSVEVRPNVVCMHEQDDGILYKHTNYRTMNDVVARRRILVLQMIITVANYEYIFIYHFDQIGGIELEVRATGVVSTQYIDPNKTSKWGNVVAPSVFASSHQHIFNFRIDPAVDGYNNTVQVCDTKLVPWDKCNPKGTGFYNDIKSIESSSAFDADQPANRYVKIVNENVINPISKKPVGYKVVGNPSALLMAPEGTVARERARFSTHHYWVSKYKDQEVFAGGVWTNQSNSERGGVNDAIARNEKVRNDDVVLWHSFGITHHVRVEDFPVMPIEKQSVHLTPFDFFTENPALDVPRSDPAFNRSVEVKDDRSSQKL